MYNTRLAPGQKLSETWEIEFEGRERRHEKPHRYITGSVRRWYHGTYYGGSTGEGETVDEARLSMVLGLARAICDDESAFQHDADELANFRMLHWFQDKIKELRDEEDSPEDLTVKRSKQLDRRIRFLERLQGEWQEENDFWPEENDEHTSQATREADRRIAAAAVRVATAAEGLAADCRGDRQD